MLGQTDVMAAEFGDMELMLELLLCHELHLKRRLEFGVWCLYCVFDRREVQTEDAAQVELGWMTLEISFYRNYNVPILFDYRSRLLVFP